MGSRRRRRRGEADHGLHRRLRAALLPSRRSRGVRAEVNGRFVLETAALNGGTPLQLTYAPGNALPTDVLRDGRILFEACIRSAAGSRPKSTRCIPTAAELKRIAAITERGGRRANKLLQETSCSPASIGMGRFTSALAHEVDVSAPAGEFAGDIVQVSADDGWCRGVPSSKSRYSVAGVEPEDSCAIADRFSRPASNAVQPVLVAPRPVAEPTSFGPARLELRQPALPERLHVEVQVAPGICGGSEALHDATKRASRNCWEARR